jgi:choline kinase
MTKHNTRFIAPAKKIIAGKGSSNLSIIIPAAGASRKMKSLGSRSLIELKNGQNVLFRQLSILSEIYPQAEIIVVLGFEAFKVYKHLPRNVRAVINHNYDSSSVLYSIMLGLINAVNDNILVVYGDLVFNHEAIDGISTEHSAAVIDSKGMIGKEEVGVVLVDNQISYFSYGVPAKWSQILFLTGKELELFRVMCMQKDRQKMFPFEIMNDIIEKIGYLPYTENPNSKIVEIDTIKDIQEAISIC